MNLLMWLQNLGTINLDRIRASVADGDSKLAYLVRAQYYSLHLSKEIGPKMIIIFILNLQTRPFYNFNDFQLPHLQYYVFPTFYQNLS